MTLTYSHIFFISNGDLHCVMMCLGKIKKFSRGWVHMVKSAMTCTRNYFPGILQIFNCLKKLYCSYGKVHSFSISIFRSYYDPFSENCRYFKCHPRLIHPHRISSLVHSNFKPNSLPTFAVCDWKFTKLTATNPRFDHSLKFQQDTTGKKFKFHLLWLFVHLWDPMGEFEVIFIMNFIKDDKNDQAHSVAKWKYLESNYD